jgi:MoxR-like ATPase
MQSLAKEIRALVTPVTPTLPAKIVLPNTTLIGLPQSVYRQINAALASGKQHFILYGPPGTGKTTLAEYIARELSNDPTSNDSYVMLTASSSWSNQDLVGGYQPLGPGAMGFIPGAMLRHFDKPIVIDELNRCPIDKVIGPLFSVLSGQSTTLPYRVDIKDPNSDFFVILPADRAGRSHHEFAPTPFWRLVCTLNTVDKTQLGQISYALSRRFSWIRVGVPDDLGSFTRQIAGLLFPGIRTPVSTDPNPIADMWRSVNQVRELGGAPIIDMMKAAMHINPALDLFATVSSSASQDALLDAFQMNILPMLDGISTRQATDLAAQIGLHWSLPVRAQDELLRDLLELAI